MGRPKGSKNKPKDPLKQSRQVSLEDNHKKAVERGIKGKKYGVCKSCGKRFKQEFNIDQYAYESFDLCEDCRKKEAFEKQRELEEKGSTVYNALLNYSPFPAQQEMHKAFENHRFLVLNCILPGQYVQGCDKKIEDVCLGDEVISRKSRLCKVERVTMSPYNGSAYKIKSGASIPIEVTKEHPIFVAAVLRSKKNNKANYKILKESFLPAEKLYDITRKDYRRDGMYCFLKIPRLKGIYDLNITEEEAFLDGMLFFKSELDYEGDYTLNFEKKIPDCVVESLNKANISFSIKSCRPNFASISIHKPEPISVDFAYKILQCKNVNLLKSFVKGAFSLTQNVKVSNKALELFTEEESLAYFMQLALARLGCVTTIRKDENDLFCKYFITIKDSESAKIVGIKQKFVNHHCFANFFTEDGYYTEITSIKEFQYEGNVYDLTTTDHSFTVNNIVVHNCGNRTGKDRFSNMAGIMYFVECLNENRHIDNPDIVPSVFWWIIAPTETMAKQNWMEIKKFFPKDWVVSISNNTMSMYTIGGGVIEVRSAYDPESLVGVGLDLVTITEAARIKDLNTVWANLEARLSSPGRGRQKDRNGKKYGVGKGIINSSPIGKNFFYTMWTWGQPTHDDYASDWVSFSLPWTVNPANAEKAKEIIHTKYGDITYEESLRRRIGDRAYRQNYLADFLAGSGQVFKDFKENCCVDIFSSKYQMDEIERAKFVVEWKNVIPYHRYRISWDIATGSSADSPVIMIRDLETNKIVRLINLYGKNYEQQYQAIAYWSVYYNHAECVYSSTGHTACVGQLEKLGVKEVELNEQGGKKAAMIQNAECAVQNGDVQFLMDGSEEAQNALAQIEDYTEKDGKYSNESEPHDDWASALYLNYYDYQVQEAQIPWVGLTAAV